MAAGEKPKFYSYVNVFGRYRGSWGIPAERTVIVVDP